ncbi:MAG: hypothetical protein HYS57_00870 [Parcubacteria group bacterium]|nr:hypothetical protein [Parcubacteria group bacterium]
MANIALREKATQLRRNGESIARIARILRAPKSTVSYWCRSITLTHAQVEKLVHRRMRAGLRAVLMLAEKRRKVRLKSIRNNLKVGKREVGKLGRRDLFIAGIAIYWAEGDKRSGDTLAFTNSDPQMVLFMMRWLRTTCKILNDRFILRVTINIIHASRVKLITQFWSKITRIPENQFSKPLIISTKNKKIYTNSEAYHGVLRIKVRRATELHRRLMGWLAGLMCVQ